MDIQSYCDNVCVELTGWKLQLGDIVRRLDDLPSGDKEKVVSEINDMHILIEEFNDRILRLMNECSVQWEPDNMELEGKLSAVKTIWKSEADLSYSEPL